VAIAADHVGGDKDAVVADRFEHGIEECLQFHHVVQALVGDDHVVAAIGLPAVEVAVDEGEMFAQAGLGSQHAAALQHGRGDVQAFDAEIGDATLAQQAHDHQFAVAVACADADDAQRPAQMAVLLFDPARKEVFRVGKAERFEQRTKKGI